MYKSSSKKYYFIYRNLFPFLSIMFLIVFFLGTYLPELLVKLNAKNSWKKEQNDQIIREFLSITEGKTRKKSFL